MIKNILITGGAGYIGSHISEILVKNKKKIYIVDNLSTGYRSLINKKAKFFKLNIEEIYDSNNSKLYVSSGSGTWGPKMRLGTFNEIIFFHLSK